MGSKTPRGVAFCVGSSTLMYPANLITSASPAMQTTHASRATSEVFLLTLIELWASPELFSHLCKTTSAFPYHNHFHFYHYNFHVSFPAPPIQKLLNILFNNSQFPSLQHLTITEIIYAKNAQAYANSYKIPQKIWPIPPDTRTLSIFSVAQKTQSECENF